MNNLCLLIIHLPYIPYRNITILVFYFAADLFLQSRLVMVFGNFIKAEPWLPCLRSRVLTGYRCTYCCLHALKRANIQNT